MPWPWGSSSLRVGQQVEYSDQSSGYGKGFEEVVVGQIKAIIPQPSLVTIDTGNGTMTVPENKVNPAMKGGVRKTLSKRRHNKRTKRTKTTKRSNLKRH